MRGGAKARVMYEEAVEYLCRHLETLREVVDVEHWDAPFEVIRDGDPSSDQWRDAVRELHEAAEAAGIPGGLGLQSLMGGFPAGPTPRTIGWVCPSGRCARVEVCDEATPDTPLCALTDEPMRIVD